MTESETIRNLQERINKLETENSNLQIQQDETVGFFNLLMENIPFPVFYKDAEGKYVFCNHAFAEFNGWNKEHFIGKTIKQSIQDPALAEIYHKADLELMQRKGTQAYVSQVKDAQENLRDVIFNKVAIVDNSNQLKGLLGFIIDISNLKEIERELKNKNEEYEALNEQYEEQISELHKKDDLLSEQELLFRQIAENTKDVFILRDQNSKLIYVSPHFKNLTGRLNQDVISQSNSFMQWIHPDDLVGVQDEMTKIRSSGKIEFEYECRIVLPDNTTKWVWIRSFEIPATESQLLRTVMVLTDITKRKKLELELEDYKNNLELIVKDRTEELQVLNEELSESNGKIRFANRELSSVNDQLSSEIDLRKQAQAQLSESEEKLRSFVDQSIDGITIVDETGKIIEWNKSMETILNFSREDTINTYFWDVEIKLNSDISNNEINIEEIKRIGLKQLQELNAPIISERKILSKNNKYLFLSISTFPIFTSTGKFTGRIVRNITQEKLAQNELNQYRLQLEQLVEERARNLKESEARFRQVVESSPMGMHLYRLEENNALVLKGANKAADELLGIQHSSILERRIEEAFPPLALTDVPSIYKRLAQGMETWKTEQINYQDDFIQGAFEVVAFHTGTNQMAVMFNNITSRVRSQETIRKSEEKFRTVFNNSTDMIFIININLQIIETNKNVGQKLNIIRDTIIFKDIDSIYPSYSKEKINDQIKKTFELQETPDNEFEIITKENKLIPVQVSTRLIEYDNKKAVLLIMHDITERKEIEQKIVNAIVETEEKERSRLASDLHDEIGPLLSSIKMYLSTISSSSNPDKLNHVLDQINELVKNAVTSTREISNAISPHLLTNHGLHAAVYTVVQNMNEFITIHFESSIENIRFASIHETIYYRIINELINNTIKHANATIIKIVLEHKANLLILKYSDNGIGYNQQFIENNNSKGMGIYNLLSRASSIQGKHSIKTAEGKGFSFELSSFAHRVKD